MTKIRDAFLFVSTLSLGLSAANHSFANPPLEGDSSTSGVAGVTGKGTGPAMGVFATSASSVAVYGASSATTDNGSGVVGGCVSCPGVVGQSTNSDGVRGMGGGNGVYGFSNDGAGVYAVSGNGNGVYASGGFNGVLGITSSTNPLAGGVHGVTNGAGNAMRAESNGDGNGLVSTANAGYAVYATSATTDAIVGVAGTSLHSAGVWGKSNGANTYGIYSSGDLYVTSLGGSPGNAYKPGGGAWLATSDARVKKDVASFTPALSDIEKIHPVRFKYNGLGGTADTGKEYVGVIAQDLEKVLPFMVSSHKSKLHEKDTEATDIKEVDPSAFTYVLINAVKELSEQNKQLAREVTVLNAQAKQINEIAKLMCADHPGSKACDDARQMASASHAAK